MGSLDFECQAKNNTSMTAAQWKIFIGGMAMCWGGMLSNAESPFGLSMAVVSVVGALVFLHGLRQKGAAGKTDNEIP